MMCRWFGAGDVPRVLAAHERILIEVSSVHLPLADLVEQLNRCCPAVLAGYGTLMVLLAAEQGVGRLRICPAIGELVGETLSEEQR